MRRRWFSHGVPDFERKQRNREKREEQREERRTEIEKDQYSGLCYM